MPRFFIKSDQIIEQSIYIVGEDVRHIKNVLRKQIGDFLEICDQQTGKTYNCQMFRHRSQ